MRKNLCFNYRDPWVLGHRCMSKGQILYIKVSTDNDEEEQGSQAQNSESTSSDEEQPPSKPPTSIGAEPPVEPQPREKAKR